MKDHSRGYPECKTCSNFQITKNHQGNDKSTRKCVIDIESLERKNKVSLGSYGFRLECPEWSLRKEQTN